MLAGFNNNQKTGDGGDFSNVPGNSSAFRDLLSDKDVSRETADDLLKVLFDLIYQMTD